MISTISTLTMEEIQTICSECTHHTCAPEFEGVILESICKQAPVPMNPDEEYMAKNTQMFHWTGDLEACPLGKWRRTDPGTCPQCQTPLKRWENPRFQEQTYCPTCGHIPAQWGMRKRCAKGEE
jgi:hypothetical protein